MKVYIAESILDHEPGYLVGAFATREGAIAYIQKKYPECTGVNDECCFVPSELGQPPSYGSTMIEIHEMEVQD